jgi:hypothetical protein
MTGAQKFMAKATPNPITDDSPIGASDWRRMVQRLLDYPQMRGLGNLANNPALQTVLMPAVALALWIRWFMPDLVTRARAHVLVAGAAEIDGLHEGRWFQIVPYLLGRPQLQLDLTVLYQDVGQRPSRDRAGWLRKYVANFGPATESTETLGVWLAKNKNNPDLVMLFQPGLEHAARRISHDRRSPAYTWLDESELPAALERGVPIGLTAFEQIEFEQERWLLEPYGIKAEPLTLQNPFVTDAPYDMETPPMGWGSFLWRIAPDAQFAPVSGSHPVLQASERAGELAALVSRGQPFDLWSLGRPMTLRQYAGSQPVDVIMLDGQFAVDATSGDVMVVSEDFAFVDPIEPPLTLGGDSMTRYPRTPTFLFERTVWGADALVETLTQLSQRIPAAGRRVAVTRNDRKGSKRGKRR